MRDMTDGEIKTLLFEEVESLRAENEKLQRLCDQITKSSPMNTAHELDRLRARMAELEGSLSNMINRFERCARLAGNSDEIVKAATADARSLLSPPSSKGEGE